MVSIGSLDTMVATRNVHASAVNQTLTVQSSASHFQVADIFKSLYQRFPIVKDSMKFEP
jgi:hypothetical protein